MTISDPFATYPDLKADPFDNAAIVTPDDGNDLPALSRAIMVTGVGEFASVRMTLADGTTVTLLLEQRRVYPFRVRRVHATGTFGNDPDADHPASIIAFW